MIEKKEKRIKRHKRVTSKIGNNKPRLCVFRSNKFIYAQIINDGRTIVSADDKTSKGKKNKVESSKEVGEVIAKKALENKIDEVVFDRGGYKYHGRVKALAEGARQGGLKF